MTQDQNSLKKLLPDDLIEDYAEAGAEDLIAKAKDFVPLLDNMGSNIPWVKTAIAAIKFPKTLTDILLGRKVYAFLYSSGLNQAKMDKFRKKFSKEKQEKLWEQVVLAINSHDNKERSAILGKLFSALIDEYINEEEFSSMVYATNNVNLGHLESLKQIYMLSDSGGPRLKSGVYYSLVTTGLVDISNTSSRVGGITTATVYPPNQLGWKYTAIVFNSPKSNLAGINVGDGELIVEVGDGGLTTNNVYPLKHFEETGKTYSRVDVFLINHKKQILCEEDTELPVVIASSPVRAGSETLSIAWELIGKDMTHLMPIRSWQDADKRVHRTAYIAVGELKLPNTKWRALSDIKTTSAELNEKDDKANYKIAVLEQMERFINGEFQLKL